MKKKLLIVVPNLQLGGQERVATKTADILKNEYDIKIVTFDNVNPVYSTTVPVIDFKLPVNKSHFGKIINVIKRAKRLRKIRKAMSVDFCISYGFSANLVNALSGKQGKTVVSIRGFSSVTNSLADRLIYKYSNCILCCSQEIAYELGELSKLAKEKIEYCFNPYDIDSILELGKEPVDDFVFSDHTIVTHGRLAKVKNYERLIRAFSIVKKEFSDAKLLIIGEGEQREVLQQLIDDLEISDSVTLIGLKKNPFAYISKSSLYVLSSDSEGFPNSLVEGMVFLPVVSMECKTGPKEILADCIGHMEYDNFLEAEYGLLVKQDVSFNDSVVFLSQAIKRIYSSHECITRYGLQAKKRVSFYSNDAYKEKMSSIL